MAPQADPEIRRALLEEARDRLRSLRRAGRPEAVLAIHSLAASAVAAGLTDLHGVLTRLEGQVAAGESGAIDKALGEVLSALERTERGEDLVEVEELLECFAAEAAEHVTAMGLQLDALEQSFEDREARQELYRVLHTFKGAAAIVGQDDASRAAHLLEDMLQKVIEGQRELDRPLLDLLRAGALLLRAIIEEPERAEDHRRALTVLAGAHGTIAHLAEPPRGRRSSRRRISRPPSEPRGQVCSPFEGGRRPERRREAPLVLRVLVEETLELLLASREARTASSSIGASTRALRDVVGDIHAARAALVAATAEGALAASPATDLGAAASAVEFVARRLEQEASRVGRSAARTRRFVDGMRTTPASWLFDRLAAVAEEAALKLCKSVTVELSGEEVEVDRAVAGRILEPLLHLVRNAVAHGCEEPAQRVAVGKDASGRILLAATAERERVTYVVQDDGAGIDVEAIRESLLRSGLRPPEEVEEASEEELLECIFHPRISTQVHADEVSGRGVGLDAVRSAVWRLGGSVRVSTRRGEGTRFEVRVPRGIGHVRALVLRLGRLRLALPVEVVHRTEALPAEGAPGARLLVDEGDLPVVHLASRLGLRRGGTRRPVAVLVELGDDLTALEVERVEGIRELTWHSLAGVLSGYGPYRGVAQDDEGELVLLLDEKRLLEPDPAVRVSAQAPRVLLADDSKTVRGMVSRALSAAGYEVDGATDGIDAWQRLMSERYDLLLTDLEMPRLGGLDLVERVRCEPRLARLPVVVLTSRVSSQARRRAGELGVRAFVVKPTAGARLVREVEDALEGGTGNIRGLGRDNRA